MMLATSVKASRVRQTTIKTTVIDTLIAPDTQIPTGALEVASPEVAALEVEADEVSLEEVTPLLLPHQQESNNLLLPRLCPLLQAPQPPALFQMSPPPNTHRGCATTAA